MEEYFKNPNSLNLSEFIHSLSILERIQIKPEDMENYGYIVRQSPDMDVTRILLDFNRGNLDFLHQIQKSLGLPKLPDNHSIDDVVNLSTLHTMVNTLVKLRRWVEREIWYGDTSKNKEGMQIKYPKGLLYQVEHKYNMARRDINDPSVPYFIEQRLKDLKSKVGSSHPVKFGIVLGPYQAYQLRLELPKNCEVIVDGALEGKYEDDGIIISDIFILPLDLTIYNYFDYTAHTLFKLPDNIFTSDMGMYRWVIERSKWDARFKVSHIFKIETIEHLSAVIRNVRFDLNTLKNEKN